MGYRFLELSISQLYSIIATLKSEQNGWHFGEDIFKTFSWNNIYVILIWISLKFVPESPIVNKSALVQVMAWCSIGDKPLLKQMVVDIADATWHHIWLYWVNKLRPEQNGWHLADNILKSNFIEVFSSDQAALWMVFSVRLSVCPSVRLSHLFDYVPIIVSSRNFQELSHWTRVRSMQKVKVRGQRSRSQRSRPKFSFPDCNSSLNSHMMMKWYI